MFSKNRMITVGLAVVGSALVIGYLLKQNRDASTTEAKNASISTKLGLTAKI